MTEREPTVDETRFVKYDGPDADQYTDLVGVMQDLDFSRVAVETLLASWSEESEPQPHPSSVVHRALWSAALVSYARCFSGGVRGAGQAHDIAFSNSPGGVAEAHAYFMVLRDKHIAHSVGPLEQTVATVGIEGEAEGDPKVVAIGHLTMTRVLETRETTETFLHLVRHVEGQLERTLEALQDSMREHAKETPIDELAARPTARLVAPGPEVLDINRKQASL